MAQPLALVNVYFAGYDMRKVIDLADSRGFECLWLLRDRHSICWALPKERFTNTVMPTKITKLIPGIAVFPQVEDSRPCIEEVPLHNCVLRFLQKVKDDAFNSMQVQLQFNLTCEYRMFLVRT